MNIDQREWELQERALREEREGAAATHDPGVAGYREIARALRHDAGGPPPGFAAAVSAAAAQPAHAAEVGIERWLLRALAGAFGASCVGAVALYGSDWRAGFAAIEPVVGGATALNWALAAGACLAMSWGFGRLRDQARHAGRA